MVKQRIVMVRYNKRGATKSYKLLRCNDCDSLLVTAGRFKDELVKCPCCTWVWSLKRLGLKIVGDEYEFIKE